MKNAKVLIVEDVITTGKSALECSKLIELCEGNLIGFACIIDRSDKKILIREKIILIDKFYKPT